MPLYGITMAFKDFKGILGIMGSPWVGLKHFERFFSSSLSYTIIKNTLVLNLMQLILGFPIPILLAIVLHYIREQKYKKLVQTSSYMPHFISVVVVVGMMYIFLSPRIGLYGHFMKAIGVEPALLMGNRKLFRLLYVLSGIWQHAGWDSIIYIASLAAVSPSLYEASKVDGANMWQRVWYIDLPQIAPTIIILLILRTGRVMDVGFEKVFLLQNDLNIINSEVLSTYVYRVGLISAQFSFSTAIGLLRNIINAILLLSVNYIANKVRGTGLF